MQTFPATGDVSWRVIFPIGASRSRNPWFHVTSHEDSRHNRQHAFAALFHHDAQ
jgi:hypothetical protein